MKKIDAIKMVRKIRDKQSEDIAEKTTQDKIDYFRKKAIKFSNKVEELELNRR